MLTDIALFALIGFFAQIVDGALGMAYGVSATSLLLSMGVPPALASASVKAAESVTTAISGTAHWRLGNVNRQLALSLIIPGVVGGILGAYLLSNTPIGIIKPAVSAYLITMGIVILVRAFRNSPPQETTTQPRILPFIGGFFDAIGGGGWGPIVTSTLVARGLEPRFVIGSVNLAEFFVTTAQALTFVFTLGALLTQQWPTILGLLLGGAVAAPFAALLAKRVAARPLLIFIGILIIAVNIRTLLLVVFP